MNRKKLTPQEKKLLSYSKDCRNMIAESRSRSRFAIAKRRAMSHQAFRLAQKQTIKKIITQSEPEFEAVENNEKAFKLKSWRKLSDKPLGNFVAVQLKKRRKYGINSNLKISKILLQSASKSFPRWRTSCWGFSKIEFDNFIAPALKKR